MGKTLHQRLRLNSPWMQNFISGIGVGCSAGLYVALNLLGAGGGRPDSAQVVQVVNATLCSVWFLSSSFGGSILNKLGPGPTMCIGVQTVSNFSEPLTSLLPLALGVHLFLSSPQAL